MIAGPPGTVVLLATALAVAGCSRATFTDADLAALRQSAERTVVYVWSPHMPLSVDGYEEIAAAAAEHELALVPLLFSESDRDFAVREAARVGIPRDGLREVDSDELRSRNALVHAPTMIVFDERGVSPALPGYRNAEGYADFIREFLER